MRYFLIWQKTYHYIIGGGGQGEEDEVEEDESEHTMLF